MAVRIDGALFIITQYTHVTPGNLRAFVQVKLKNLTSGATIEKRLRSGEDVEQIDLDRRQVEYLYSDADGAVFMDSETFDQFTISEDVLGDALKFMKPNTTIVGLMHDGRAISVELPASVELEVTDTPPGIKNATATNVMKEATLETGLVTKVPPFINVGEKIRVSTATGEYQSRAN